MKNFFGKMLSLIKEIWYIPIIVILVIIINMFICRVGVTVGDSMNPTLKNGMPLLINLIDDVEEKDVIIFRSEEKDEYMVKRVIGMPGDTVQIKGNVIYINEKPITDAVDVVMRDYGIAKEPVKLSDDEYFVMGDNRNNSYDSRMFGPINKDDILGIVEYSIVPFEKVN